MNQDPLVAFGTAALARVCTARRFPNRTVRQSTLLALFLLVLLIPYSNAQDAASELLDAAKKGDVDALRSMLSKGGDVNAKNGSGRTALMEAAYWGRVDAAKLFLEKGADTNAKDKEDRTA